MLAASSGPRPGGPDVAQVLWNQQRKPSAAGKEVELGGQGGGEAVQLAIKTVLLDEACNLQPKHLKALAEACAPIPGSKKTAPVLMMDGKVYAEASFGCSVQ